MKWAQKQTGFTIIELLIVIVVIAILAAITIVAYGGIQAQARNTQFLSAMDTYEKAIRMYYVDHATYPSTQVGSDYYQVCLGDIYPAKDGFSSGRCMTDEQLATQPAGVGESMPSVNQALAKYVQKLPDASTMIFNFEGQPYVRGIVYQGGYHSSSGHFATIYYYINGDQKCGRGTKGANTVGSTTFTVCNVVLTNP